MRQDPEGFEREYAAAAEPKVAPPTKKQPAKPEIEGDEEGEDGDFTSVGKGGKALGFTPDSVFKNLQAVQESRGKKVI
jgi:translation initiation factor 3 subunit C